MALSKLPPVPQSWYDENRERFDAETQILDFKRSPHKHFFIRMSGSDIRCKNCTVGWIDTTLKVVDGKIEGY